jgi:hypothetical protein
VIAVKNHQKKKFLPGPKARIATKKDGKPKPTARITHPGGK